jgi:hypothetical protein
MTKTETIGALNDKLRTTFQGGKVMMTDGVASLPEETRVLALSKLRAFDEFTPDNDPHREHDFGSFTVDGERFFFKLDYDDKAMECGSEDPTDPTKTTRVLTLMLAEEY